MTDREIAKALENLIREDAKRPTQEQIRDLIEAGVIDEQGRVLIGRVAKKTTKAPKTVDHNGPADATSPPKVAGK